jgi:hypothetical protein
MKIESQVEKQGNWDVGNENLKKYTQSDIAFL